jgi:hypothetical protein
MQKEGGRAPRAYKDGKYGDEQPVMRGAFFHDLPKALKS